MYKITSKKTIEKILTNSQKRARVRTLDFQDVQYAMRLVHKIAHGKLKDTAIGKNSRVRFRNLSLDDKVNGTVFHVNLHATTFAASYMGTPYATYIEICMQDGKALFIDSYRKNCGSAEVFFEGCLDTTPRKKA